MSIASLRLMSHQSGCTPASFRHLYTLGLKCLAWSAPAQLLVVAMVFRPCIVGYSSYPVHSSCNHSSRQSALLLLRPLQDKYWSIAVLRKALAGPPLAFSCFRG